MEGQLSEKTCRTCLQESDGLTSLYEKDDDTGPTLLEKLRFCASMEVLVSEFKPSNACPQCVRCIAEYYDFKRRCELSERTLEDLSNKLLQYTITKDEVILKDEDEEKDLDDSSYLCNKSSDCIDTIDDVDDRDEGDTNSTADAKTESDDFNWSGDDDSNWAPCFDEVVNGKLMFGCDQCDVKFPQRSGLKRHKLKHRDDRDFECDICKKSFKSKNTLLRHIRSKIMQRRRCDGCGKLFDTTLAMLKHRAGEHARLNPYVKKGKNHLKCMVCEKTFDDRVNLHRHVMSHAMEHRFKCDACGELFDTQSQMEAHKQDYGCIDLKEKSKISCVQCDKKFLTLTELKKHRTVHSADRNFECHFCKKSFKFSNDLRRHIRQVHLLHKRRCDGCDKLFDSLSEMLAHRANAHPHLDPYVNKGTKHLRCELCKKTFDCKDNLFSHSKEHLIKCYKCGERFETILQMQTHTCDCQEQELPCNDSNSAQITNNPEQEKCANPDLGQDDVKEKNEPLSHPVDSKEEHPCNMCSRSYSKAKYLQQHRWRDHLRPKKRCDTCGASFREASYLRKHMEIHNDRRTKFVCETCGKSYSHENSLRLHIEEKHADELGQERKVYKCKFCEKQYYVQRSLTAHMRLHRHKSVYECHLCQKRFNLKIRLKEHLLRHNKPYNCDICDMRFLTPKSLQSHKLCHARHAFKPYGCELCAKRFSTASAVSFHMRTLHNGKKHLKCDVCGLEFYNRFHYAAHYSKHTGVKPYRCDICGKGYNYKQDFLPHRKQCAAQKDESLNKEAEMTSTSAS